MPLNDKRSNYKKDCDHLEKLYIFALDIYTSDYTDDGEVHPAYSPPPRNNYPYRIIRIIYREPGSMSLMRGEYRHPKHSFGWLKLFLHIADSILSFAAKQIGNVN